MMKDGKEYYVWNGMATKYYVREKAPVLEELYWAIVHGLDYFNEIEW